LTEKAHAVLGKTSSVPENNNKKPILHNPIIFFQQYKTEGFQDNKIPGNKDSRSF